VRKALPPEFAYILEELIHEDADRLHKQEYYNQITGSIIALGRAEAVIHALTELILRLAVDRLHIIGDLYDRGPGADRIMDVLMDYHSVDIQWGNHDINWMGAASGADACICNVIRICARYNNLQTLEEGYGINLVPLASFAMECYEHDPCSCFVPSSETEITEKESGLTARMQKAITVIQFKAEGAVIKRNPNFEMDGRNLLHRINFEKGEVEIDGKVYPMLDSSFPTIDPKDPYKLTADEEDVLCKLRHSFMKCEKLQAHVRFLFNNGSLYNIFNGNLLYHGCIPMTDEGELKEVEFDGKMLSGKDLFDAIDKSCRQGFSGKAGKVKQRGLDVMWYLWCGADSPLYGKNKMATFERYFIADKKTHHEEKDPYFTQRNKRSVCEKILENFGLTGDMPRIINGHVPVEIKKGESPIKAEGKLLDIDGGFAKAYQKVTGMAGYTLIYNSKGLALTQHKPFTSAEEIVENNEVIISTAKYIQYNEKRIMVADTDIGKEIRERINNLQSLVKAYDDGIIKEKR
jgi:fructose-1,6-bisphosphatase-3